jgi:glycosyltransferase involved in cell wall biosynthesis
MNPRFSLIIPTLNRLEDMRRLFVSIQQSTLQDLEVIVIDQNEGALLDELCAVYQHVFPLRREKIRPIGVAHARNYGFQFATGQIINFPDDDCELTPSLLEQVSERFTADAALEMLFGRAVDRETLTRSVTRFSEQAQAVTAGNVFSTTVEFTMFLKHQTWTELGGLDEKLGVGTYFGAEEGSDFVLRALYQKKKLHYDPALLFYHAQKVGRYDAKEFARAFSYSRGFGRLTVKHVMKFRQLSALVRFFHFQARACVAVLLFAAQFKFAKSRYYLETIMGRIVGVFRALPEFL